jgi:hypothetical protein
MEHNSQQGATRMGFDPLRHVVYSIHTPRSEAQTKTATRIQLPIHLGNTLMKKIGVQPSQPGARQGAASRRRILRQSRLGPEARQNMNNVYVRLLRRARTVNKLPSLAHLRLLKDEEGRWPRPVSVCGLIGSGPISHAALSPDSRSLARSLALSPHTNAHPHTHASIHTPLKTLAMESQKGVIQRSAHGRLWLALWRSCRVRWCRSATRGPPMCQPSRVCASRIWR